MRGHLVEAIKLGLLMGISKTEMQRRLAELFEKQQRGNR